jgi:hypothetical protein
MEGFMFGGPWKVPLFGGLWKVPLLGGLWKVPLLSGPWKVPLFGGQWKENEKKKKTLFPLFPFPPNKFYLNFHFFH